MHCRAFTSDGMAADQAQAGAQKLQGGIFKRKLRIPVGDTFDNMNDTNGTILGRQCLQNQPHQQAAGNGQQQAPEK